MPRKIAGIGETVLDIVFKNGQPIAAVPGGSVFNSMVSLGRTVGKKFPEVALVMESQTGSDYVADIVLDFMEKNGLDTAGVQHSCGQSNVSMAMLDENNNARYEFFRDKAGTPFRTPDTVLNADDIVLFGSLFAVSEATGPQTKAYVSLGRNAGAIVYYDINFRKNHPVSAEAIEENMALSTIVRGSDEDIEALYGSPDAETAYREHISALCPNFICTKGGRDTEVFSPGVHAGFPVPELEHVETTIGAGDNFNAGILYALIRDGLMRKDLDAISEAVWRSLIPTALRFSANVCASLFNYVDTDFDPEF